MNSMRSRIMLGCAGHFIPKLRACDKGKHLDEGRDWWREGLRERWREGAWRSGTKLTFPWKDICSQWLVGGRVRYELEAVWLLQFPKAESSWKPDSGPRILKEDPILPKLWPPDHVRYLLLRTGGLFSAHPLLFYDMLSWSNCKPAENA